MIIMVKIGFVSLMSSIFHPYGLSDFFNSMNTDWRYVYWPYHVTENLRHIHFLNFRKTVCYNTDSPRYKDVAWEEFNTEGWPVIRQGQVDEDSRLFFSHLGECREYIDYHEIRTINEPWGHSSAKERVQYIMEWVQDCDFILIDISDCAQCLPEKILEALNGIKKELSDKNMKIFLMNYLPILGPALKYSDLWINYFDEIMHESNVEYVSSENIQTYAKNHGFDVFKSKNLGELLHIFQDYHHEKTLELFSKEIVALEQQMDK